MGDAGAPRTRVLASGTVCVTAAALGAAPVAAARGLPPTVACALTFDTAARTWRLRAEGEMDEGPPYASLRKEVGEGGHGPPDAAPLSQKQPSAPPPASASASAPDGGADDDDDIFHVL